MVVLLLDYLANLIVYLFSKNMGNTFNTYQFEFQERGAHHVHLLMRLNIKLEAHQNISENLILLPFILYFPLNLLIYLAIYFSLIRK